MSEDRTTYFTFCDANFFPGLVALVNSLAVTGNRGRIVVLDGGLTAEQRQVLAPHVEFFAMPAQYAADPVLSKPFARLVEPDGVAVIIDSDMIVTRNLGDLIAAARDEGKICLFSDFQANRKRWFAEWEQVFELSRPPRRQPYLNAGFVLFDTRHHPDFLPRWWHGCERIPLEKTRAQAPDEYDQPFWDGDQDVMNAVLMSEVPAEAIKELPQEAAPTSDRLMWVRVKDLRTLACEVRGVPTVLLHMTGGPKPWQEAAWLRVRRNGYVQLLPRVLLGADVPIRLQAEDLPVWLRPGPRGAAALRALSLVNGGVRQVVRRTPPPVYARLRTLRSRLAGAR
jgi:hypothetical protein